MARKETPVEADVPPLTPQERAALLEQAGEAYFVLCVGDPQPELGEDHSRQYWLVRQMFFHPGVVPPGTHKRAELQNAKSRADAMWEALPKYMVTDPDLWKFPETRLSQAAINRHAAVLRKAAKQINSNRYPEMADPDMMFMDLPAVSFVSGWNPDEGTVEPEYIGCSEQQVPFALSLHVRPDMIMAPEVAVSALRRILGGPAGEYLCKVLQEDPELRDLLSDEEPVRLILPTVRPFRSAAPTERMRYPSYRRVKEAVNARFHRVEFDVRWVDGYCYVTLSEFHPDGSDGRFICHESPEAGADLGFLEV